MSSGDVSLAWADHSNSVGAILVSCHAWKCALQLFSVVQIFLMYQGVICCNRWPLSDGHKNNFKDWCLMNSQPAFLFLTYFKLNEIWRYYQKYINQIILNHNSLKLSFTNIWGLCSDFVDCESFLESNSPNILALCKKNLNDWIDSGNFSVRDYLPLIQNNSTTHMHGLAVIRRKDLLLGTYYLTYVFDWLYFTCCLLFPLLIIFFVFIHSLYTLTNQFWWNW